MTKINKTTNYCYDFSKVHCIQSTNIFSLQTKVIKAIKVIEIEYI